MIEVPIVLLRSGAREPMQATGGAAAMDLFACIETQIIIPAGCRQAIQTGIAVQIPPGCYMEVLPRSGLALRHGVTLANSPGTIDSDYRGEIIVILQNHGDIPFPVTSGMAIAQVIVKRVDPLRWVRVRSLDTTARGAGGFGSTG